MKCIIIEDELPAQKILQNYISRLPELELLGCFQSAIEANTFISKNTVELIFLDISLPYISGMAFLKTIPNPPKVIMTTAYHQYAAESYDLDMVIDYLVKPFSFERFLKAINRMPQNPILKSDKVDNTDINQLVSDHVFINVDKSLHKIILKDLLFVTSEKNYVTIVTKSTKHSFLGNLKDWTKKLPSNSFIQVHRSYVLNYNYIDKINGNLLSINNYKIPIGRNYKENLFLKLNLSK